MFHVLYLTSSVLYSMIGSLVKSINKIKITKKKEMQCGCSASAA